MLRGWQTRLNAALKDWLNTHKLCVTYRIRETKGCAPGNRAQPFCYRRGSNTNST
jgi:hypothetical protein